MGMYRFSEVFRDTIANGIKVLNTDHSYIHYGKAYKTYIELATFANGQYLIHTPADKYLHFKNIKVNCVGGSVRIALKRGTDVNPLVIDSVGSSVIPELIPPNNLNDNVEYVSGTVITKTPTYVDSQEGEDWIVLPVNGLTAVNNTVSESETQQSDNEESVLKPDTDYVLDLSQVGVDTPTNFTLIMFWYEEDGGRF